MANIRKIAWKVDEKGCWVCTSHSLKGGGYPAIQKDHVRKRISHVMYEKHYGTIPKGLIICHHCDNPSCINPEHLFVGTHMDNAIDKMNKGRQSRLKGENAPRVKLTDSIIIEIRNSKVTSAELMKKYNISHSQIVRIRNGDAWGHIGGNILTKGENRKGINAKLTEEQVREIRLIENMSQSKIAELYGIKQTTVSEIKLRKKWKHVI